MYNKIGVYYLKKLSEPSQTFKMELFAIIVRGLKPLVTSTKCFFSNIWLTSEFDSYSCH